MKARRLSPGETELLIAVLKDIKSELNKCYWNKNQKEMRSPFDNTGESYNNDTFSVNAYYWGDDERLSDQPNFRYKDLKVYWYKYLGRATAATIEGGFTLSFLKYMLADCKDSIRRDYEKKRTD